MDTLETLSIIVDALDVSFLQTSDVESLFTSDMSFKHNLEFDFDILTTSTLN